MLHNTFAQLCQGSLGDAVVSIDFGTGPNTGPPLSSSVTNYNYNPNFCPNDGFYTMANSTDNCFGNTWLTLSEDHTPGDNNGYMMLINASFFPGDFYVQQVDGLCGGTTYEFAAWLINVIRPSACDGNTIRPNITFTIETTSGQVLQTYKTGNIDATNSPVWKQYGLFFTTPSNTSSVVVRITNNAPGGCGNDLALDDITFRPCGPKVSVSVNGAAKVKDVCTGDTASLHFGSAITGGYGNTFYQWQKSADSISWTDIPGANKSLYTSPAIITPGRYYFRLAVADGSNILASSCRVASDFVTVNVNSLPVPGASNNGPVCENADLTLAATGGGDYSWSGPGNYTSTMQSPVVTGVSLNSGGLYRVKVTSAAGCVSNDSTRVTINPNPKAGAGENVNICEGTATLLQGSGINAVSYTWSPAAGLSDPATASPLAAPSVTTLYILTVSDGVCKDFASVLVSVFKQPVANAGPDKAIVGTRAVTLEGQVTGANLIYFWTPDLYISSDTLLSPQVVPPHDMVYTLHAISKDGCGEDMDDVLVQYFRDIYIPNAFTPNNDGKNDQWNLPELSAFPMAEVSIYNRYGQLLFFNKGYTSQWNGTFKGKDQPSGIYIYVIDLKNGSDKLRGTVTLIR